MPLCRLAPRLVALLSLAALAGCPKGRTQTIPVPAIASFGAAPTQIAAGQSATLSWSTSGASALAIDQGVGPVTGTSVQVLPSVTTTYTLTASGGGITETATALVTVTPRPGPPDIANFSAAPAQILPGATSTLAWTVTGATSLSIDHAVGAVTGATSKQVSPSATTAYTLTATNEGGTSTATAQVQVIVPPVISSFTANPSPVVAGAPVALAWTVAGAQTLTLDGAAVAGSGTSATPASSHTYRLAATNLAGTASAMVTVTVSPAAPPAVISFFAPDAPVLQAGGQTTLRWHAANASSLAIDHAVGGVTGTSVVVTPAATTTYTLTAQGASGAAVASATVTVLTGTFAPPGAPPAARVSFTLHSGRAAHPISPFIYGYNASAPSSAPPGVTELRLGGNRWTAWNWETNASNAGSDYLYESDAYLTASTMPAEALRPTISADQAAGVATLVTVPTQGWVSADENGPVSTTARVGDRFFQSVPRKGGTFAASPDTSDRFVFEDELVHWLSGHFPTAFGDAAKPLHLSLDNEPDLWNGTHLEIQRAPVTYAELARKAIDLASAIKDEAPAARIFGPASYGFNGFVNLQQAPDASADKWFVQWYLEQLQAAGDAQGRRLVDVLDLHWYSEAIGGGERISGGGNAPAVQAARVQAPRSLWDPAYSENSWVQGFLGEPIELVPRLRPMIAAGSPGTLLSFSEYNHGGGDDISGAVAQADTLGIFGREGVFAAMFWELGADNRFIHGAWRMFRDYDGAGAAFGNRSFQALCDHDDLAAVYASMDAGHPERVVVVAINRGTSALTASLALTHTQPLSTAHRFELTATSPYDGTKSVLPEHKADVALASNTLSLTLPPMSVTTLSLVP